jgi:hypothetical protein
MNLKTKAVMEIAYEHTKTTLTNMSKYFQKIQGGEK